MKMTEKQFEEFLRDLRSSAPQIREYVARWVKPPNAEDLRWQKARRKTMYARQPNARILEDILLSIGGWAVAWNQREHDLEKIIERGVQIDGLNPNNIQMRHLTPHACHTNVARLWRENPVFKIMTGYALSPGDAVWRQHSWCLDETATDTGKIIETCTRFLAYWGFVLREGEAELFSRANDK